MDTSNTGTSAISRIPILTGLDNYFQWRNAIEDGALVYGALHVLTEEILQQPVRPLEIVEQGGIKTAPPAAIVSLYLEEYREWKTWKEKDQKVMGLMRLNVSTGIRMELAGCNTSKSIWDKLAKLHQMDDKNYQADIEERITTVRMTEGDDPVKFLEDFSTLLLKAQTANFKLTDERKATYFLRALPPAYDSLKAEWKSVQRIKEIANLPVSTFEELRGMFNTFIADLHRQDEVRLQTAMVFRKTHNNIGKGSAYHANKDQNKTTLVCWNCGKQGHSSKECRSSRIGNGMTYKPKSLPFGKSNTNKRFNKSNNLSSTELAALQRNMAGVAVEEISEEEYACLTQEESIEWLVDLGASSHICNNKELFSMLEILAMPKRFKTASGDAVLVTANGKVTMKLPRSQDLLTLHDVMLMENSPHNLLSQGTLIEKGWTVDIDKEGGSISKDDCIIPVYRTGLKGTLRAIKLPLRKDYYSNMSGHQKQQEAAAPVKRIKNSNRMDSSEELYLTVQDRDTVQGWHIRLGHLGVSTIKRLAEAGQLHITDKDTSTFKMEECEVCAVAKTTRLTFDNRPVKATQPLEIVHSDIAGPLKPDVDGRIYYVTFIDDLTGLVCIGGLKNKTAMDVLDRFKDFKRITELALQSKLQCLRTDGGGEYMGGMKTYLQQAGIVHQVTTPYTPQLNGSAERANRTLKEMTSSMLINAKMDHKWWYHAMQYACTIINMGKHYQGRSLEQIIWKHKPSYGQLHPFGTDCWARIPREGRHKNDLTTNKAITGRLLHPNINGGGYLIVVKEDGREITLASRDVVFKQPEGEHLSPKETHNAQYDGTLHIPQQKASVNNEVMDEETPQKEQEVSQRQATPPANIPIINQPFEPEQDDADGEESDDPLLLQPRTARRKSPRLNIIEEMALASVHQSETQDDPQSYRIAMQSGKAQLWQEAINKELKSISDTGTWQEIKVPEGASLVDSKWVFKTKLNERGEVVKYKARIVARGFTQEYGINYFDTYSPVARLTSLRVLLTIVAAQDLELYQMDADTAFLNGTLEEDIYMDFPDGYQQQDMKSTGLKLIRSLYGLKQSPRVWWKLISTYLGELGFTRLSADWGLYHHKQKKAYLLLYVDDVLIAAEHTETINGIRDALKNKWKWSDIGTATYILGLKLERHQPSRTISISQQGYIQRVLERFGMQEAKTCATPLYDAIMRRQEDTIKEEKQRKTLYQQIVGSLMWCAMSARPDIVFAVGYLSRFSSNPSEQHLKAAKRTLAYLKGTIDKVLTLGQLGNENSLIGYCDADYAGDMETRRSTTGYCFKLLGSTISWTSIRQSTVATSTCEAEYMALAEAAKEAIWLSRMLQELGFIKNNQSTQLYCDNQGALALAGNPAHHKRSKHIDIRYHYIREMMDNGHITIHHVGTNDQAADMLTKPLKDVKHIHNCKLIHLE